MKAYILCTYMCVHTIEAAYPSSMNFNDCNYCDATCADHVMHSEPMYIYILLCAHTVGYHTQFQNTYVHSGAYYGLMIL